MVYDESLQQQMEDIAGGKKNRLPGQMQRCRLFMRRVKDSADPHLLGFAYYYLADAYFQTGRSEARYVSYVTKAIPYEQAAGDRELLTRSYNLLGINAINHGNHQLGIDYFLTALKFLDGDSPDLRGMIYFNIGQIYDSLGELKKALAYVRMANRLIRKAGIKNGLFVYMYCICAEGMINLDRGRTGSARHSLESLLKLMERYPDFDGPHTNLYALAFGIRMSHELGDFDYRDTLLDNFFAILERGEYQIDAITEIMTVGRFLAGVGMTERLERLIELFLPVAMGSDSSYIRMTAAETMIEYYSFFGREDERMGMLETYYEASMRHKTESNEAYGYALQLREKMEAVEEENVRLQKQAGTDALTGLPNRFALNEEMDRLFNRARGENKTLGLEILDVDFFKEYNDTYGHQAGDDCLAAISDAIRRQTGCDGMNGNEEQIIFAARYGGDEFVLIYLGYEDDEIMSIAQGLRRRISELNIEHEKSGVSDRVSISQGIRNSVPVEANRVWDYLYAADNALYQVKRTHKGEIELLHKAVISDRSFADAAHS